MIRYHQVMGKEGMTLSVIAAIAMFAVSYFFVEPTAGVPVEPGICLPGPGEWPLVPFVSRLLNPGVYLLVTAVLWLCNKQYTFVQGNDTVLTGMFLIMVSSNPWLSGELSGSGIMALANLLCMMILFGCYRKRNATQELFIIATILALGSMFQYGFLFMVPVYIIGAMMLKCFSFRGFIAMLLGFAAPYWVGIGFGLIPPDSFRLPTFTNFFDNIASKSELFVLLLNLAVTFIISLFVALNNITKLYAGNTQRFQYNMVLNVLGVVTTGLMIVDFSNLLVYTATFYVIASVQLANLFALREVNRGSLWLLLLSALYITGFFFMI